LEMALADKASEAERAEESKQELRDKAAETQEANNAIQTSLVEVLAQQQEMQRALDVALTEKTSVAEDAEKSKLELLDKAAEAQEARNASQADLAEVLALQQLTTLALDDALADKASAQSECEAAVADKLEGQLTLQRIQAEADEAQTEAATNRTECDSLRQIAEAGQRRLDQIRQELHCPILHDLMHDPVMTPDGHTYERSAVSRWLVENRISPLTGLDMPSQQLLPNLVVSRIAQCMLMDQTSAAAEVDEDGQSQSSGNPQEHLELGQLTVLYHVTTFANARVRGCLGPGIYFSTTAASARRCGQWSGWGPIVVLQCFVYLGNVKAVSQGLHTRDELSSGGYNSFKEIGRDNIMLLDHHQIEWTSVTIDTNQPF